MSRFLLVALCLLAACAPLDIYYREGAPVAEMRAATADCAARALRLAPVDERLRRGPPRYAPPERYCDTQGNCVTQPGEWELGEIVIVDVNAEKRSMIEGQCMAARGYRPVSIPRCPPRVGVSGPSTVLPDLSPQSCSVPLRDGSFAIVRP